MGKLIRREAVLSQCTFSSRTLHERIKAGTFPDGIHIVGRGIRAWFEHEVSAVVAAIARGASDDELRKLASRIVAARRRQRKAAKAQEAA